MRPFLILGSLLLAACGTRGPLTLPPKPAAAQPPLLVAANTQPAADDSKAGAAR